MWGRNLFAFGYVLYTGYCTIDFFSHADYENSSEYHALKKIEHHARNINYINNENWECHTIEIKKIIHNLEDKDKNKAIFENLEEKVIDMYSYRHIDDSVGIKNRYEKKDDILDSIQWHFSWKDFKFQWEFYSLVAFIIGGWTLPLILLDEDLK